MNDHIKAEGWTAYYYIVHRVVHVDRLIRPDGSEFSTAGVPLGHAVDLMPRRLWIALREQAGARL